jgi:uncharacterized protein (TIGR01244 family)
MFKKLTSDMFVAPQIDVAAIAEAKALGVTLIINNRPDGESDDQTPGAEIETAARAAGLDYVSIPVTQAGFSQGQVAAMKEAVTGATGKILAYCRSGTRSTRLWTLSEAAQNGDPDALTNIAAKAGYDVSDLRPLMDMLKAQA